MTAIGHVTRDENGGFKGQLGTVSIRAEIEILPVEIKPSANQPDYRIFSQGVELGAGWIRIGETSGKEYVSLTLAAPEFGPRKICANLGRTAGKDDEDSFTIIWNPAD